MDKLIEELKREIRKLDEKYDLSDETLNSLFSVYPFNRFEYVISHLLAEKAMTLSQYIEMRQEYAARNKYLHLFEIAPRTFGETWGENHLSELVQELKRPTGRHDASYLPGQYDFWCDGVRVEAKSSRVAKKKSGDTLTSKAMSVHSADKFEMNFQQLKPLCCDVFVWIAVWRDEIKYWVISSEEVRNSCYYQDKQHRGNTGEGQLWIKNSNIASFDKYLTKPIDLYNKIMSYKNK